MQGDGLGGREGSVVSVPALLLISAPKIPAPTPSTTVAFLSATWSRGVLCFRPWSECVEPLRVCVAAGVVAEVVVVVFLAVVVVVAWRDDDDDDDDNADADEEEGGTAVPAKVVVLWPGV